MIKSFKSPALYIALSLAIFSLTACDKGDKKADTASSATTTSTTQTTSKVETAPAIASATTATVASTTASSAPVVVAGNTAAATATIDQVMSMMGSGLAMANKMSQQTEGKQKFSAEQITCVATKGNEAAVVDMQAYLQQNFNETEMKQMNDYFASSAGKKQSQMTKNMVAAVVKDSKDLPKIQPSAQEQKDMETFWKSATGTKLATLLKDKEKLRPVMSKIIDKKQVDCNLPKGKAQ